MQKQSLLNQIFRKKPFLVTFSYQRTCNSLMWFPLGIPELFSSCLIVISLIAKNQTRASHPDTRFLSNPDIKSGFATLVGNTFGNSNSERSLQVQQVGSLSQIPNRPILNWPAQLKVLKLLLILLKFLGGNLMRNHKNL